MTDFDQVLTIVCSHFGIPYQGIGHSEPLDEIRYQHPGLAEKLLAYKNASETCSFITSDYELRHKMKDVWEQMCRQAKHQKGQIYEQLLADLSSLNIQINTD